MFSFFSDKEEEEFVEISDVINNDEKKKFIGDGSVNSGIRMNNQNKLDNALNTFIGFLDSIDKEVNNVLNNNAINQNDEIVVIENDNNDTIPFVDDIADNVNDDDDDIEDDWVVVNDDSKTINIASTLKNATPASKRVEKVISKASNSTQNKNTETVLGNSSEVEGEGIISSMANLMYSTITDDLPSLLKTTFENDDYDDSLSDSLSQSFNSKEGM